MYKEFMVDILENGFGEKIKGVNHVSIKLNKKGSKHYTTTVMSGIIKDDSIDIPGCRIIGDPYKEDNRWYIPVDGTDYKVLYTDESTRVAEYIKNHYDRVGVSFNKSTKERLVKAANKTNKSIQAFISDVVYNEVNELNTNHKYSFKARDNDWSKEKYSIVIQMEIGSKEMLKNVSKRLGIRSAQVFINTVVEEKLKEMNL